MQAPVACQYAMCTTLCAVPDRDFTNPVYGDVTTEYQEGGEIA